MLVITLGDPHGVGIELLAAQLGASDLMARHPVVLVGSAWQWRDQTRRLGLPDLAPVALLSGLPERPGLYFADVGTAADAAPAETLPALARGGISVRALQWLRGLATLSKRTRLAVVTAPIDKHACVSAGFAFPGQTEFCEDLWQQRAVMILAGPRLRVGLVTNHLALSAVPAALTRELVEAKLELFARSLSEVFAVARPRIGVCGLNPHAGDQGLFGDEEARVLEPALASVRAKLGAHAEIVGPVPADTAFYRGYHGEFAGVLAMYHDQGLGPLKTVHFDDAVNVSGGLPHFRASPDHGPARDLFLTRRASGASMEEALRLAAVYLESSANLAQGVSS